MGRRHRQRSYSYGIIYHVLRGMIIVNGGPGDDVDVIVHINKLGVPGGGETMEIFDYDEAIETTELFDDGPCYTIDRMVFTANNNNSSVVNARYLYVDKKGREYAIVANEHNHRSAFTVARLVLWCECIRNDLPKAIHLSVEVERSKLDDDDSCVICHEEYRAEDMIGKLTCNHTYHEECIKTWLMKNTECPICRNYALWFDF